MKTFQSYLRQLNVFGSSSSRNETESEQDRSIQIVATRIYLVLLMLTLIIAGVVFYVDAPLITVVVRYPSVGQMSNLPREALCPCSDISILYSDFIQLNADYHPVCSSDFVSDRWLYAIYSGLNSSYFYYKDFRAFGSAQFRALASLCRLTEASVSHAIASFDLNALISAEVLSESVLRTQAEAFISELQKTAANNFIRQLEFVRQMTHANNLQSALQSNYVLQYYRIDGWIYDVFASPKNYPAENGSNCQCLNDYNCHTPAGFYNLFEVPAGYQAPVREQWMEIPGFFVGCVPEISILFSSLACLYYQTCVDQILSFFPTTERFIALKLPEQSRFKTDATVQSIVDQLMVEQWTTNISYDHYFAVCAPMSCSYTQTDHHTVMFIIIKLISLLSGLTMILKMLMLIGISIFQRFKTPREEAPKLPLRTRLIQLKKHVKRVVIEVNLFKRNPCNERQGYYQCLATRLYLVCCFVSVYAIASFILLTQSMHQQIIINPTETQYAQLEQMYPQSLSCSCNVMAIHYSSFISVEPVYHQLCSSPLLSSQWTLLPSAGVVSSRIVANFENNAGYLFRALFVFCDQARKNIEDARHVFLQTQWINSKVVNQRLFYSHMNASLQTWRLTTENRYLRTIQLVRAMTQGNQLMNSYNNVRYYVDLFSKKTVVKPAWYSNCSCAITASCHISTGVYETRVTNLLTPVEVFRLPNFFVGCYPVEAILSSTLECFYNQTCIEELGTHVYSRTGVLINASRLNSTRNLANETIQAIANRLMVDLWLEDISFASYYNACAPHSCTYEYTRINDVVLVLTTILGVFGGLSLLFKLLILLVLRLAEKMVDDVGQLIWKNLVKTILVCSNERQLISRLNFLLIVFILGLFFAFYTLSSQIIMVNVKQPSFSTYMNSLSALKTPVHCSCSQVSIQYKSFLKIIPKYHPVCSSDFVSDRWITSLGGFGDLLSRFSPTDLRSTAIAQFYLLASICRLSKEHVNSSLIQLMSSDFVRHQLLSSDLFEDYIQVIVDQFTISMPNSFLSILSIIREMTASNLLMSTSSINWIFDRLRQRDPTLDTLRAIPLRYRECDCGRSSQCVQFSRGMLAGCYPLEALFQSTLQCLYNQSCINHLILNSTFQAMSMIDAKPSHFNIETNVESIVNQLMVDDYIIEKSYGNYFTHCAPFSCSYSYLDSTNFRYGMTYLISLYGGLVIISEVITKMIVSLLRSRRQTMPQID